MYDLDLEDDFVPRDCSCDALGKAWVWHTDDCPFFIDSEEYYRVEEYD